MTAGQELRRIGLAAAMLAISGIGFGMAKAQEASVLVELYTSQGCVSCPPADAFFAKLKDRPEVVALSLHVDYWDYLGWQDALARPEFTERQKSYAKAVKAKMIYTPQMVIAGQDRLEGTRPESILQSIATHHAAPPEVDLKIARRGDILAIDAAPKAALSQPAVIQLVRYLPSQRVMIDRGENAGQEITYHNIVTSWQTLGLWEGKLPLQVTTDLTGEAPVVVILQEQGPGRVLAVSELK